LPTAIGAAALTLARGSPPRLPKPPMKTDGHEWERVVLAMNTWMLGRFGDGIVEKHLLRAPRGSGGPVRPPDEDLYRALIDSEAVMDSGEAKSAELGLIALARARRQSFFCVQLSIMT
jgi:hypothetical protein